MQPYPDPDTVAQAVVDHLAASEGDARWRIAAPPRVRVMPWSTLYFLAVTGPDGRRDLVAKIAHFPDQTDAAVSWTSEELLRRGQREFDSMKRVFEHFQAQPDPMLRALPPRAYLPRYNVIVMDYITGEPLYEAAATLSHLLTPGGRRAAARLMRRAGQWLSWLHALPADDVPPERLFGPADALDALRDEIAQLGALGVPAQAGPAWDRVERILTQVACEKRIWAHGDFHMRNVLVLPGEQVLGFDTALERADCPHFDLGKFAADLKTRRARVLRLGRLPSDAVVQQLTDAFLSGYTEGQPMNRLALALYEGRFLFQKWRESLEMLRESRLGPAGRLVQSGIVNPTFARLVRRWMETVDAAGAAMGQ